MNKRNRNIHRGLRTAFISSIVCLSLTALILPVTVEARPGFHGGGGHHNVGRHFSGGHHHRPPHHRPPHHRPPHRPPHHRPPHHRPPHHGGGHHHHHPHYWPGGHWAGVATAAAIGTIIYTLPPACSRVVVNGVTYEHCGDVWYRPVYRGNQVVYEIVAPPR